MPDCTNRVFCYVYYQDEMAEDGNATSVNHREPADNVEVLPRKQEPRAANKTTSTKKIRRLTLKLEEIERER